jgi:hypothetical protein
MAISETNSAVSKLVNDHEGIQVRVLRIKVKKLKEKRLKKGGLPFRKLDYTVFNPFMFPMLYRLGNPLININHSIS